MIASILKDHKRYIYFKSVVLGVPPTHTVLSEWLRQWLPASHALTNLPLAPLVRPAPTQHISTANYISTTQCSAAQQVCHSPCPTPNLADFVLFLFVPDLSDVSEPALEDADSSGCKRMIRVLPASFSVLPLEGSIPL